ncbi:protein kinase, partial [candidate division GN15 bacterium]|nr:protein kinase [candidate division GN15 bacterium]
MRLSVQQSFGPYVIRELLGEGGSGEVYLATDSRLRRTVALKLIRDDLAESSNYSARLAEEARVAATIDSPHVAKIWEFSELDGIPFVAMEFVAGDLPGHVRSADLESKLGLALKIARGIADAHAVGLVHRDLKPDNIRVANDGTPRVLDFGLATDLAQDNIDEHGEVAGTVKYMAPEQLTGSQVTAASDQFSFGVILYEMLTGHCPFEGAYSASIVYATLHEEPPLPTEYVPDLPSWLVEVVRRLIAKQPTDRFPNMREVIRAIEDGRVGRFAVGDKAPMPTRYVTVMDLRNLAGDREWDYFCEGFSDDVVGELARRTELVVSAQPSRDVGRDIRELFNRFRCDYLVSGSLLRWHESIRLQLFIHENGGNRLLASEKFEDKSDRLFDVLSSAASRVAELLSEACGQVPIEVPSSEAVDVTAYDYYLRGKSYYQTNKPENLVFAIQMFERALSESPRYPLALTGLADVYLFQYMAYYDRTSDRLQAALDRINAALDADPDLPEAHRSLGRYYMFTGEAERAEASFKTAIELNPKYAIAYRSIGWLKYLSSDYEAAMQWAQDSLRLAPTDPETMLLISLLHTYG